MKWNIVLILVAIAVVGLISGCNRLNSEQIKPLNQLVPNCNEWDICTNPTQNVYNVTNSDCVRGLSNSQAQMVVDILIQNNIKVDMNCVEYIKELHPAPVATIVDIP